MILRMTIFGAVIIMVTVLLRRICLNKLPKSTFLALWGVALLRLLVPGELPSRFSIYAVLPLNVSQDVQPQNAISGLAELSGTPQTQILSDGAALESAGRLNTVLSASTANWSIWQIIWLVGVAAMVMFFALAYYRTKRDLAGALPVTKCPFLERWQRELISWRPVRVLHCEGLTTPVSVGVLRPQILLPTTMDLADEQTLKYVLTHELEHLRHLDTLWKLLALAALCIHWFNPLVWLLFVLLNRDLELACDERVLRRFGEADRAPYALSLIAMAERGSSFTPLYNSFSKHSAEERITTIMRYKKVSGAAMAVAVLMVFITATAFATSPIAQAQVAEQRVTDVQQAVPSSLREKASQYVIYEKYGLTYEVESDQLFYEGQLVRYFEDSYPVGEGGRAGKWHFTRDGVVDVLGIRDFSRIEIREDGSYDPSGELVGLQLASEEEFAARDVEALNGAPAVTSVVTADSDEAKLNTLDSQAFAEQIEKFNEEADRLAEQIRELTGPYAVSGITNVEGLNTINSNPFEEYEKYGLVYNEEVQRLYYEGKLVRYFEDILQTGPSSYERFMQSTNRDGEIDLHCTYDEEGNLVGVKPFSQAQFEAKTKELEKFFID